MRRPVKYVEKAVSIAAVVSFDVLQYFNRWRPQKSFVPKWSDTPLHMNATVAGWYKEHGKHAVYAGGKPLELDSYKHASKSTLSQPPASGGGTQDRRRHTMKCCCAAVR